MKLTKDTVIITVAIILPFGLVALGIWKAYELLKKPKEGENGVETVK